MSCPDTTLSSSEGCHIIAKLPLKYRLSCSETQDYPPYNMCILDFYCYSWRDWTIPLHLKWYLQFEHVIQIYCHADSQHGVNQTKGKAVNNTNEENKSLKANIEKLRPSNMEVAYLCLQSKYGLWLRLISNDAGTQVNKWNGRNVNNESNYQTKRYIVNKVSEAKLKL